MDNCRNCHEPANCMDCPYSAMTRRMTNESFTCRVCGGACFRRAYCPGRYYDLCGREACFGRAYWLEKVDWRLAGDRVGSQMVARIDGSHYQVGPEPEDARAHTGFLGFGGAEHVVRFTAGMNAGLTVVSHNLWSQGEIPREFRTMLPDNAEFVREQGYE